VRGPDNEVTGVKVPFNYDGAPVMIWNDGHEAKIMIGSDAIKDDFVAAGRVNFSQPAGVQPQLALPLLGVDRASTPGAPLPARAGSAVVHPSPAHLSLSCHALVLAAAQGIKRGDFDNFNSDAVANANAVTPVGGVLLKKHLGPDRKLIPRQPHSSSSLMSPRDEDSLNAPSTPSRGMMDLLADGAREPSVPHSPWLAQTEAGP
jgi:hypothetical protein